MGQPVLGAALRHQRRRGALQHPGPPGPAAQPDRAGGRPAPGLPRVLLTAPAAASLLGCPVISQGSSWFVFVLRCLCSLRALQVRGYSQGGGARHILGSEMVLARTFSRLEFGNLGTGFLLLEHETSLPVWLMSHMLKLSSPV